MTKASEHLERGPAGDGPATGGHGSSAGRRSGSGPPTLYSPNSSILELPMETRYQTLRDEVLNTLGENLVDLTGEDFSAVIDMVVGHFDHYLPESIPTKPRGLRVVK